ncbi:MAG: hypothetical protein AB8B55_23225 [Mariniblastus sp.]
MNSLANVRKIFLVDGLGAVLSALMHGVVLVQLETTFGMPANVLLVLAGVACCFAVYSLTCSRTIGEQWRPFLQAIAIANLIFCGASILLIIYFLQRITILGLVYFVGEIVVVAGIAMFELKTAGTTSRDTK